MWHRFAIHASLLLLAACASNFLVSASHALDLEPRELAKRFTTQTDRRLLDIGINGDVAQRLSIPNSFPIRFEYYYDSVQGQIRLTTDPVGQNDFSMDIGTITKFNVYSYGSDIMIPATARFLLDADRTMICTFVWVVKMRLTYNVILGMANLDLYLNTTKNGQTAITSGEFSWTFLETK